jgi:PPK2 family polyphosphate:nucleotide phosphotransferase
MAFAYEDLLRITRVPPGKKIDLRKDYDHGFSFSDLTEAAARERLEEGVRVLSESQERLYAADSWAVLVILQGLDSAGKDSTIKHVMSGVNPQGVTVTSFKTPTSDELDHDYLWRHVRALPERGCIGIFNRSYYEEVIVTRVHPDLLTPQKLPATVSTESLWAQRFEEINNFERYLTGNGIAVVKFYLNISKDEQKRRFLERLGTPEKYWKFSLSDIHERAFWDDYLDAYEDLLNHTSTPWAPWFIVPADHKRLARIAVAEILSHALADLHLEYPVPSKEVRRELQLGRKLLEEEGEENPSRDRE